MIADVWVLTRAAASSWQGHNTNATSRAGESSDTLPHLTAGKSIPYNEEYFPCSSNYRQHSSVLVAEAQSRLGLLRGHKLYGYLTKIFCDISHEGTDAKCSSRRSPAARDFPERRVQSGKPMRDAFYS
jgi:hypothetical protein